MSKPLALVKKLEKIVLPQDHYRGPSTGLSTENGDSWLSAGTKINALIDRIHELEAMVRGFFTGIETSVLRPDPISSDTPVPTPAIVVPPAAAKTQVPQVSPLAPSITDTIVVPPRSTSIPEPSQASSTISPPTPITAPPTATASTPAK